MKIISVILLLYICHALRAQQGFAVTRITTDDGTGLSSNVVSSIYQDEKGFIWVGTANGLQRFDGSKFIQFSIDKPNVMPHAGLSQILKADSGALILAMPSIREFGIFNPSNFNYRKIAFKTLREIPLGAGFHLWKDAGGEIYLNVHRYGILHYLKSQNAFVEDSPFPLPAGWQISSAGIYEDNIKHQYWICCDSGLCVYDKKTKQLWYKNNNPANIPLLDNIRVQDGISELYIDKHRRFWIFGWPRKGNKQARFCLDSTGNNFLNNDSIGLNTEGYSVCRHFYETKKGALWIYGSGALFNYDKDTRRFYQNESKYANDNTAINYETVYQIMEDRDGSMWIATDQGLYFRSLSSGDYPVVNLIFDHSKEAVFITDLLEMPNGDFWLSSADGGIKSVDKYFRKTGNVVYSNPPPASWPQTAKNAVRQPWAMYRQAATGNIWIGCTEGALLIHSPAGNTTQYFLPPVFDRSLIRYITGDNMGQIWFGTQSGRLIKWNNSQFTLVKDIGAIIYKVFIDKQGWIWLSTHEKGLYALDPVDGNIIAHYTADQDNKSVYMNTGSDIEQLNDSIIVFGAGALNFINKKTGTVKILKYEDGLPSNSVARLRMDKTGFLWIITSNGLCRYNPVNNRITPYGAKDGIFVAGKTNGADYQCQEGNIIFAGNNALVMFNPSVFTSNQPPPDVSITDFKLFNQYLPVDSLLQLPEIKLKNDQNSFSLYYASLSYMQSDKLTYYYKMEGIDKDWIKADRNYYINFSLLPPGKYIFKIYCENIEGISSLHITEVPIYIKPPFWRTLWFISTMLFALALIIYEVHSLRVKRLLDVEKLRNHVARDLHDDMGSTLSTINILSSMARVKMTTDTVKTAEYLSKISDNSQRMMEAMDDIVWSIKPSNDNMQKITARMREFATNVLEAKDIELVFKVDEDLYDVKLNMQARKDFFLIFKEAVNNAAKYSKARNVWIQLTTGQRKLILIIRDDGIGFDVARADNGNGLGNMLKRADAIRGKVIIQSKDGMGTEVSVSLPLT